MKEGSVLENLSEFDRERLVRLLSRYGFLALQDETASREELLKIGLGRFQKFSNYDEKDLPKALRTHITGRRCCVPDLPNGPSAALVSGDTARWTKNPLTYTIVNTADGLTVQQVRQAFQQSIAMWTQHINLDIVEGDANADIRLSFALGNHSTNPLDLPFDALGGTIGHAFGPDVNGNLGALAGDIHLDDAETWAVDGNVANHDVATAAAHELGHVLGFNHNSRLSSMMFSTYQGIRTEISDKDKEMAIARYGARPPVP
jgi:matrixin